MKKPHVNFGCGPIKKFMAQTMINKIIMVEDLNRIRVRPAFGSTLDEGFTVITDGEVSDSKGFTFKEATYCLIDEWTASGRQSRRLFVSREYSIRQIPELFAESE